MKVTQVILVNFVLFLCCHMIQAQEEGGIATDEVIIPGQEIPNSGVVIITQPNYQSITALKREKRARRKGFLQDIIHLKNGSVIQGNLLEWEVGKSAKIEILGGSILVFDQEEIQKIEKDVKNTAFLPKYMRPNHHKNKGFYGTVTSGFLPGISSTSGGVFVMGVNAHMVLGYQLNQRLALGVGYGLDAYIDEGFAPIYLDFRGYLQDKSATPYYGLQVGYGTPFASWGSIEQKGGIYLHPCIGIRSATRGKVHFVADIGIRLQQATFIREQWSGWNVEPVNPITFTEKVFFKRFALRLGILF